MPEMSERNDLLFRIRELDANHPGRRAQLREAKRLAAAYDLEAATAIVDEVEEAMHPATGGGAATPYSPISYATAQIIRVA